MTTDKVKITIEGKITPNREKWIKELESNFDPAIVTIERHNFEVKSDELKLYIDTTKTVLFTIIVLEPLIRLAVTIGKSEWERALDNHYDQYLSLNLVVNIKDDLKTIKTDPPIMSQKHMSRVLNYIDMTIKKLGEENLYEKISTIRLVSKPQEKLFIVCHTGGKPVYIFDWENNVLVPISPAETAQWEENLSPEMWFQKQSEIREMYEERIRGRKKNIDDTNP